MAVATQHSAKAAHRHLPHSYSGPAHSRAPKQRFFASLSQCLFDFVVQLLPTTEELTVKEDVRKLLERLIRTIEPDSRLLSFGSTANGFSLRNSDMDLCCLIDSQERLAASDLVTMLGDLLERETKFNVKTLPHARIPIVKLSLEPSPALPLGIACDIGFENRLALENTRLLYCYAIIDPTRVRTLVLFLKVWCKRRKINSPYKGTLSSYGYVLLVIYFLVHVKNPPVLPNLQQMPPMRPISHDDIHIGGFNTWFFDDIALLRQRWQSANTDSIGQLLIDFFKYFSRDFSYNTGVASIRAGLLKKESKGWQNDLDPARYKDARERNRFCIEDPFETDFNVARCVTRDGLYTIRGEFMRASRILSTRPERAIYAIAQLCEERMEGPVAVTSPTAVFVPPRLSPFPPQTPYTVGSSPMRLTRIDVPDPKSISDVSPKSPPSEASSAQGPSPSTPDHMAPKRSKWTSPPPPSASAEDRSQFESQLGLGLALATLPTDARQMNGGYASSSNNSEILTDDGDDLQSIRSLSLSEVPEHGLDKCNGSPESLPNSSPVPSSPQAPTQSAAADPRQSPVLLGDNVVPLKLPYIVPRDSYPLPVFQSTLPGLRGRSSHHLDFISTSPRLNSPRRSHSGPPGPLSPGISGKPFPLLTLAVMTPLPPSPPPPPLLTTQPYVYYETAPSPTIAYPVSPRYPPRFHAAAAAAAASMAARVRLAPSPTATPTAHSQFRARHAHSHSMTTIHARTPSPATEKFASRAACGDSVQSTGSTSPPSPPDSLSAGSGSPVPSSLSSQCDAGFDVVRWEESGENGEDGAGATVAVAAAAVAEEEDAKTEEWAVMREKAPPDAQPQPTREPLPP